MNFYAFHIGDYSSATQHLTETEDLAYRRMMDVYYVSEHALPLERRSIYRLVRANSDAMREAVDVVLSEYFTPEDDGWHHKRCDAEIAKARAKSEKAKANGKLGGKAKAKRPLDGSVANATQAVSEPLAPNPNPNPSKDGGVVARARDPDAVLEARLREAAGWNANPSPNLSITGPIQALLDSGADLDLDVLPVIRNLSSRAAGTSWNYFVKAIARARDDRIAAATVVSLPTSSQRIPNGTHRQKPSRDETFDAIDRRIEQLAEAERRAAGGGEGHIEEPAEG